MSFSMIVTAYDASIMFQLSICHFCLLWQRFSNMTRKCSWSLLQLPPLPMDCATVMFCSFSSRISNWDFLFASYSIVKPCFSLIIPQCPGSSSLLTAGELAFFFFYFLQHQQHYIYWWPSYACNTTRRIHFHLYQFSVAACVALDALHSLLTSSFAAGTPVHHIIPSTYISWAIILILCLVDVSCLLLNTVPSYTISFVAEIDVSCLLLNTDPSYTMSFAFLPACCFTCKHQL